MLNFIHQIDLGVAQWIPGHRTEFLTTVMRGFTAIGNWEFITFACILIIVYFIRRKQTDHIKTLLTSVLGGELFVFITKRIIDRARPPLDLQLVSVETFSFPSGHSFVAFSFYGLLTYFLFRSAKTTLAKSLAIASGTLIILLMGFSRMYLGVHWTSDVVASFAAGGIWITFLLVAFERKRRDILEP